jgi:hypothetical protein
MKASSLRVLNGLLALTAMAGPSGADTYFVKPDGSGDFPTIQAAIDAAVDGDVIELADGTYTGGGNRDMDYLGKAIAVRSQSGNPTACIIDYEGTSSEDHWGFRFYSGEGPGSTIEDVTVTNSAVYPDGFAVACGPLASPTIVGCMITRNEGWFGALVCTPTSSPTIADCVFFQNSGVYGGGFTSAGSPTLIRCTFVENEAGQGGGAFCEGDGSQHPRFANCTFWRNRASEGAGLFVYSINDGILVTVENTIIASNLVGTGVECYGETVDLFCCDVFGNEGGDWVGCIADQPGINGNISEDPLFCDAENRDFTLHADSPCAPFSPPNEDCDLIGAWPVACGKPTLTVATTWGQIKAQYRR